MLELLNQLDGFDTRGDVKVIMATNKIESLDPALIRPGRIDRKIEFPLPDVKVRLKNYFFIVSSLVFPIFLEPNPPLPRVFPSSSLPSLGTDSLSLSLVVRSLPSFRSQTKRHIFRLHTSRMTLGSDVDLEEYIMAKDELSGADIKAVCTEAGLMALRERRMRVTKAVSAHSPPTSSRFDSSLELIRVFLSFVDSRAQDFKTARDRVLDKKQENTVSSFSFPLPSPLLVRRRREKETRSLTRAFSFLLRFFLSSSPRVSTSRSSCLPLVFVPTTSSSLDTNRCAFSPSTRPILE